MDLPLMLLGFTRAVSRFLGYEPADARQALRLAFAEPFRPDLLELVQDELAANDRSGNDLNEELLTYERYLALFEALNWGVSLDDRLTRDWPFEEITFGMYWCDEFVGGDLVRGFRCARNSVHHDWSYALDVDPTTVVFQQRVDLLSLCWRSGLRPDVPDGPGKTAYREYLGGRVVGDTLLEIGSIFEAGTRLAMGEKMAGDEGAARIKFRRDDKYVPPEIRVDDAGLGE
jgi:hypothetical protein